MFRWNPRNFVILPAAHKQGFPRYYWILIMWPWPRPFMWSSWTIVLTPDMPILYPREAFHRLAHPQTPFGVRSSRIHFSCIYFSPTDGFSYERVAQFNVEWIFSKLDSGFQSLVGFRIPKPRIPDSTSKKFLDSGIRIPLHGAISLHAPAYMHPMKTTA